MGWPLRPPYASTGIPSSSSHGFVQHTSEAPCSTREYWVVRRPLFESGRNSASKQRASRLCRRTHVWQRCAMRTSNMWGEWSAGDRLHSVELKGRLEAMLRRPGQAGANRPAPASERRRIIG